jgi:AcrR family transcriptional regulator
VFQHFDDMESLLASAGAKEVHRINELVRPLLDTGPLPQRIRALIDQRARIFEFITPVRRAAVLHEPFSPALRSTRDDMLARGARELEIVFAQELAAVDVSARRDIVAALDTATSWVSWEHLRARLGLSVPAAKRVVTRTVTSLVAP